MRPRAPWLIPWRTETILDGDHAVCHVVAVTAAKMNGMKASLDGFTIKNGSSQFSSVGSTTIGRREVLPEVTARAFSSATRRWTSSTARSSTIRTSAWAPSVSTPEPRRCSTTAWLPTMRPSRRRRITAAACGPTEPNCCGSTTVRSATTKASGVAPCIYVFGDMGGKTKC